MDVGRDLLEIQGLVYPDGRRRHGQNRRTRLLKSSLQLIWVLLTVAAHSNSDAFFQPTILTAITVYS